MKISKKRKAANEKVDNNKLYPLDEASALIKEVDCTKFDSSVDMHMKLGVDPRKPDQAIRGTVTLPHGTGKSKSVLVLCMPGDEEAAKSAGADYVGLDEYVQKIKEGWTDVDVVIATPNVMPKIAPIGRILGPRGLMPNPKSGTVTTDVVSAVEDVKKGKISFRVDKYGIIHASIGRSSFSAEKLNENATELVKTIVRMKPVSAKGNFIKSLYLVTTMSPSVKIDTKTIAGI